MAEKKNQFGGPAFPQPAFVDPETGQTVQQPVEGMSIQTYAAIHLCVPMSEHPIINEMINKARGNRFADQALGGTLSCVNSCETFKSLAEKSIKFSDALLKELEESNE